MFEVAWNSVKLTSIFFAVFFMELRLDWNVCYGPPFVDLVLVN